MQYICALIYDIYIYNIYINLYTLIYIKFIQIAYLYINMCVCVTFEVFIKKRNRNDSIIVNRLQTL